jgi:hypothetical protein
MPGNISMSNLRIGEPSLCELLSCMIVLSCSSSSSYYTVCIICMHASNEQ